MPFVYRNDITELYSKSTSKDRFAQFWRAQTSCLASELTVIVFTDLSEGRARRVAGCSCCAGPFTCLFRRCLQAKLYNSPLATVAAVRGHCPAGGCILALTCDARIVTDDTKMGLNEVALGIAVPLFWAKVK